MTFPAAVMIAAAALASHGADNSNALRSQVTDLYRQQSAVRSFSQTALSPDGRHIAWSVDSGNDGRQSIYIADIAQPADAKRLTPAWGERQCREHNPVWSPDSRQLAFLSDCDSPDQTQLYLQEISAAAQPRQLTHLNGFVSHPQWASDGRSIALLFVDHASRAPTPMAAENKAVGVIDDLQTSDLQTLSVVAVDTGLTRKITPAGLYVFEYDWSPDGRQFAFTAAPPPGDDNWYIAQLYTQSVAGGAPVPVYKPHWQIALPRWSPDGRSIAFIEGLMSDEGGTGGEIYLLPAAGGEPRDLTPGRKSSPAWFNWISNREILFTEFAGGPLAISKLDLPHATITELWRGDETLRAGPEESSLSVSHANGTLLVAAIRMSWSMLPEVWAGQPGHWKQITFLNQKADLPLPRFTNINWSNDGFSVQGWLLYPANYVSTKKYPMLVAVHGGPAWIARPEWRAADFDTTLFTNFGYFVFFPNARGSYGQGEKFTQANRRDWGFGDLRDMLSGVDDVVRKYPVDPQRVGILGWSYGGSTAMMAVTQTHRFRAAVAGAGAGNWQSYYGQNSIDKWMIPYFGASVYDDPKAYARVSALTYIKNAKTPTLVLVGERDGEAPPAQSIEFWHALKELGTPTRLVIYADEGHSFSKPADQIDVTLRTLQWFDHYMGQ
jgi:dipeptidyl aminopeptidase/acylaminoacyl peptidase